jgi:hypothetical protein
LRSSVDKSVYKPFCLYPDAMGFRRRTKLATISHSARAVEIHLKAREFGGDSRNMALARAEMDIEAIAATEDLTAATERASRIAVILNVVLIAGTIAGVVLGSLALMAK